MEDIERTVIQHTEQIKTLFTQQGQLQKMVDSVNALAVSVKELAFNLGTVKEQVGGIQTDVDTLKEKPAKKWDNLTEKILWSIVAAILGIVLGKFGL
jgi:hypothetical protein